MLPLHGGHAKLSRWLIFLYAFLFAACRERLDAEIHGRRLVLRESGAQQIIFDRTQPPVVRIPGAQRDFHVRLDDAPVAARATYHDGASYLEIRGATLALGAADLVIDAPTGARASFPVRFVLPPEENSQIQPIVAARARGDFSGAMALAEAALKSDDPLVRVFAGVERGRIALRKGDHLGAARLWREASEIARACGAITEVSARLDAASNAALRAHRFQLAEELLREAEQAAKESGDLYNRYTVIMQRARLASALGDQRRALAEHRRSARIAQQLGLEKVRLDSEHNLGIHLLSVGRFQEALEAYPDPEKLPHLAADERARLDVNIAWTEIRGIQSGALELSLDSPRRRLNRAIELLEVQQQPWRLANALCTLARAELQAGDFARAESLVHRARATHPPIFDAEIHDCSFVEIEILLSSGRVNEADRALSALERRMATMPRSDEYAVEPLALRARVARAQGKSDAVDRYLLVFDEVVQLSRKTPIQDERSGFIASRTTIVAELIDLLIERGDIGGAFSVADAERALMLSDLDADVRSSRLDPEAKIAWAARLENYHALREELARMQDECDRLPSAEVPRCLAGIEERRGDVHAALDHAFELLDRRAPAAEVSRVSPEEIRRALGDRSALILVRGSKERARSFVIDRQGARHHRGPPPLDRWIGPAIDRLYVVGDWDPIQDGDPLLAARVAIAILPSARFLLDANPRPKARGVVVGDPNGDLPGARREAKGIATGARLFLGKEASKKAVLAALDGASFFHFAGHARIMGRSPWDSGLSLADGMLLLEDLLMTRARVGVAVLSACESGGRATRGELGLPHAFLLAGTRAVLATTRPLADAEAGSFIARFYEHGGPDRPMEAFRAAIADSVASGDPAWRAFRLFGQ